MSVLRRHHSHSDDFVSHPNIGIACTVAGYWEQRLLSYEPSLLSYWRRRFPYWGTPVDLLGEGRINDPQITKTVDPHNFFLLPLACEKASYRAVRSF
jgi:hypothetical protein